MFLCTGTALSASVAPEEEWSRTYGEGDYSYYIRSGQEVDDGGYILAGNCQRDHLENYSDFVLIKTDSAGNEEWNKTFGGEHYQHAYSATQTRDGGYILVGADEMGGGLSGWVVKTDSEGEEEWNRTFRGEQRGEDINSVQETSNGGYILAGGTSSFAESGSNAWLIKIDSYGNEEWNKTLGGKSLTYAYSIQKTTDGGYILACGIYPLDISTQAAWLVKTDSSGNEEWNRSFDNIFYNYNQMRSVKETADGGYILAGITRPSDSYKDGKAWLIKTNSDGEEEWRRTFDKGDYIESYSAQQTVDGGYVFAGHSYLSDLGRYESWLIKTDPNGYEEWNKTFESSGGSFIRYVQETKDKGYMLVGDRGIEGASHPWLIKLAGEKAPEDPKDPQDPLSEVKELKDYVSNLENVDDSTKNVLTVKLENAIRNLEKGETEKAVSKLEQFIDSVNKLSLQNKINADQDNILVQKTQGIIELTKTDNIEEF